MKTEKANWPVFVSFKTVYTFFIFLELLNFEYNNSIVVPKALIYEAIFALQKSQN